jgi:broad specificity phosphatase PhoE
MRWLEIRRHSLTKKGPGRGSGSDLSSEGVALAREVGSTLGPFARVATSPVPRAIETAIAMGHAVDELIELPSGYVPGEVEHHDQWAWPQPYAHYAELIARGGGLAAMASTGRDAMVRLVTAVASGEAALYVSHGGTIEPVLVACLPEAAHATWGPVLSQLEGARLGWDGGRFQTIQLRRR